MKTARIIAEKLEAFGLSDITEDTTVCVNKADHSDVEVFDSEFNTFTEAHATLANFLISRDGDDVELDRQAIRQFVQDEVEMYA